MLNFSEQWNDNRGWYHLRFNQPAAVYVPIFLLMLLMSCGTPATYDPLALYLTWQRDPSTTMTIDWHTIDEQRSTTVEYRTDGSRRWQSESGTTHDFPWSSRTVHRVELTGLQPDTKYEFRFGSDSRVYRFRTMPGELTRPLRIAIGGDTMHHRDWFERTNLQVLEYDPDFVVIGGDLAYADARPPEEQRIRGDAETGGRTTTRPALEEGDNLWYHWFDAYKNTLITENGRVIPMIVTIGNHEARPGSYYQNENYEETDEVRQQSAPYFYSLFAMPGQPGYNVLDFGDYMSIILLDSGHTNPPYGTQRRWLEEVLADRQHVPHLFPVYHIATYPSVRDYDEMRIRSVRESWVPLFEEYGIKLAFENHDHAYKRTHPIRGGEIRSDGIIYLGDGSWGVYPRDLGRMDQLARYDASETYADGSMERKYGEEYWYINKAKKIMHAIILTIEDDRQHVLVLDDEGNIIDEYPE